MAWGNTHDTGHTGECPKAPLGAKLSYQTLAARISRFIQGSGLCSEQHDRHHLAASCYTAAAGGLELCAVLQRKRASAGAEDGGGST